MRMSYNCKVPVNLLSDALPICRHFLCSDFLRSPLLSKCSANMKQEPVMW